MTFAELCNIKQHGIPLLEPSVAKLKLFDGTIMTELGEYTLQYTHKGEQHRLNKLLRLYQYIRSHYYREKPVLR